MWQTDRETTIWPLVSSPLFPLHLKASKTPRWVTRPVFLTWKALPSLSVWTAYLKPCSGQELLPCRIISASFVSSLFLIDISIRNRIIHKSLYSAHIQRLIFSSSCLPLLFGINLFFYLRISVYWTEFNSVVCPIHISPAVFIHSPLGFVLLRPEPNLDHHSLWEGASLVATHFCILSVWLIGRP